MIRTRLQGDTPFFPNMLNNGMVEVCLKEDVDKTLAEKDKQLRHQKYKRSLAMAKMCDSEENRLEAISPIFDTNKECWEYNSDYWARWQKHWLEIAEKFKEAK